MINYKIHLLRCGSTAQRMRGCYVGQQNYPLCDAGISALHEFREHFRYPYANIVFTSPLSRCVETAEILYPDHYIVPIAEFADLSLGEFEGHSPDQLMGNPDFEAWIQNSLENPPPGGEKLEAFTARVVAALEAIFNRMMQERITDIAIITHAGVIMALLASIGLPELPPDEWLCENGCGFTLLMTPQMWMRSRCGEVYERIPGQQIEH